MIARNDTISIYGLYLFDPTLFDNFICPPELDRDLLIDSIVMDNTELELLYPDGDFMKQMIGLWSRKEQEVWQHLVDTLNLDYNPIWNKDGTIEEDKEFHSTGSSSSSGESTNSVSAYNETGFHNHDKDVTTGSGSGQNDGTEKYKRREYGNIGVTTTQAMMQEEIDLRKRNNIYDYIIKSFRQRFCLLVY